ncbi:hypothetical protein ABZ860_14360 [Microbispora sp. NPDC046973]|uniref:hypothetical protein n=1 Tax=Microbispora sp. NPDC046973 TaxID=3155022 RepID=UPI0033C8D9CD
MLRTLRRRVSPPGEGVPATALTSWGRLGKIFGPSVSPIMEWPVPPVPGVLPQRQSYALFWWWLALALTAWDVAWMLLLMFVPSLWLSLDVETIGCSWMGGGPLPEWRKVWSERLALADGALLYLLPLTLGLGIRLIAVRGAGRPRVHLWTAFAAVTLVAAQYALRQAELLLDPMPDHADCSVDPAVLNSLDWTEVAWIFAPAVPVLIGAAIGIRTPGPRPRRRPSRRLSRLSSRPIALGAAALVAVTAVVLAVRWADRPATEAEVRAADGTPRYALVPAHNTLVVLDLTTGRESAVVSAPDPEFYQYGAVAPDGAPGRYLASVSTTGDGAFGGRRSRVYEVVMDGDGGAEVGDQVGGEFEGVISDLAVSPQGRRAYARLVAAPGNTVNVGVTVVGLLGENREWSAPGGQGVGGDGPLGLHWRDPDRLVFHAVSRKARHPRVVMLDVGRPGGDLLAAETLHVLDGDAFGDGTARTLPGGTRMLLSEVGAARNWNQEILLLDPPGKRPVGSVFGSGCGDIAAWTPDASGRYLLVGVDNKAGEIMGDPPRPACGDAPPYELFRVDLRGESSSPSPRYAGETPTLDLPVRRVWQGDRPLHGLAW